MSATVLAFAIVLPNVRHENSAFGWDGLIFSKRSHKCFDLVVTFGMGCVLFMWFQIAVSPLEAIISGVGALSVLLFGIGVSTAMSQLVDVGIRELDIVQQHVFDMDWLQISRMVGDCVLHWV